MSLHETRPLASSKVPGPDDRPQRRLDIRICLILGLLSLLVYNANLRTIGAGDTIPARYLPFIILRDHTLYLDKMAGVVAQGRENPFWIVPGRNDRPISLYPVVLPVLVTPLYLPAAAWLHAKGWTEQRLDQAAWVMEKVSASLIASLSVALFYLLLRRRVNVRPAVLLAMAYAFGTNTWMIGSQGLWQHGMGELLLVACMLLVTGPVTPWRSFAAGIVCALIVFNRPPDALLAVAPGLYALWRAGRGAWRIVAGAVAVAAPLLAYNLAAAGMIDGGYGIAGTPAFFDHDMLQGLAGLLFSPARGLFVFTPFLLFLSFGLRHAWRDPRTRALAVMICIAIVTQILVYAKADWRGGASWGPRWLTDALPFLVWLLAPFAATMGRPARAALILAGCVSVAIQAVGAFWYTSASNEKILAIMEGPSAMDAAWDIANTPFIFELGHPPAPRDLLEKHDGGAIDIIKADGRETGEAPAGARIVVEGWAVVNGHGPLTVEAVFVADRKSNGRSRMGWTTVIAPRPDVSGAMHTIDPTAWRIVLRTDGLEPGTYTIDATAQASRGGEFRLVGKKSFRILPAPPVAPITDEALPAIARDVAARLRKDQQPAGYWLTSCTSTADFNDPAVEMNTYLTSVLIDILAPVPADAGLDATLDRARAHLGAQIEANGLVRYFGRPDSPTIPSLGVVITPDTDDTALVWRIAGAGREDLLPRVLKTLDSYRAAGGLYRTWLAPAAEQTATDPGRADIGVHMHLLMFLANADPSAAHALHSALQAAIASDNIWIYYEKTPLVPILRQADLRKAGYPLYLPEDRLQASVPEQQPWVDACRLIAQYETGGPRPPAAETRALLKTIAAGDFALLQDSPPLVFNSDLKANSKFYWSKDFGYALWLRLWIENERAE